MSGGDRTGEREVVVDDTSSGECCYIVDGEKRDAGIHDAILDNEAADRALGVIRTERLLAEGWSEAEIARLYGR